MEKRGYMIYPSSVIMGSVILRDNTMDELVALVRNLMDFCKCSFVFHRDMAQKDTPRLINTTDSFQIVLGGQK